ncbi:MAG: rhomboid family intramembrane serine protease [Polyangiaceae bacterium]
MAAPKCPYCGTLNSIGESHCHKCKQPLPGPLGRAARDLVTSLLGRELWVTKLFMGLNLAVFALMVVDNGRSIGAGLPIGFNIGSAFLLPSTLLRGGALLVGFDFQVVNGEWWRFLSAVFVHYTLIHLLFNMSWVVSLGRALEPELRSARFAIAYLLTGVGGFLLTAAVGPSNTAGASGSVMGLFGVLVGYSFGQRNNMWREHLPRLLLYLILSWFMGEGMRAAGAGAVNNMAHVGGAVIGLGIGFLWGRERRTPLLNRLLGIFSVIAVLCAIAAVVACQFSPEWGKQRDRESAQDGWS